MTRIQYINYKWFDSPISNETARSLSSEHFFNFPLPNRRVHLRLKHNNQRKLQNILSNLYIISNYPPKISNSLSFLLFWLLAWFIEMKDEDGLPITTANSKKESSDSSLFGKGRYKFWALAAILLLAFWSMFTGTVTLRWSAGNLNRLTDDLDIPIHDDLDVLVSILFFRSWILVRI